MRVVRIFTGPDNESHFEDLEVDLPHSGPGGRLSDPVSVNALFFRVTPSDYDLDYHPAPRRQYVVNLTGSVDIETGLGERRRLGPGSILLAEDTHGRGHRSRAVEGQVRECLFIALS